MSTGLPVLPARSLHRADTERLFEVLQQQHARKLDLVIPATSLRAEGTAEKKTYLRLDHPALSEHLTEDGFYDLNGLYSFTDTAVADLAEKYDIPAKYLRRCREDNPRAFVNNVNDWTRFDDDSSVLVRLLWGRDRYAKEARGIVRAVRSPNYRISDNLDMATSFLKGLRAAGLDDTQIVSADLTDDHLYMRVSAPQIAIEAPELLRNYRSPFNGRRGGDCPIVFAGVVFQNSETGQGRTSVAPELRVEVCDNGMTFAKQAVSAVHRGARLSEGIQWQPDTLASDENTISLKIRDAVQEFLSPSYVRSLVDEISGAAQTVLPEAENTLEIVSKKLRFSAEERNGIWRHFIKSDDSTAGGIMHAVTSYAQIAGRRGTSASVERSNQLNALSLDALTLAAGTATT
ncbi:hypothetical protein [Nocardia carnea]|uniref:hypothetical protein n=1 Tax=Nocardia carnea TaxID=37328 RepID=UPI0024564840|nr:hypothetical protein [Nocardia carnea]